LWYDYEEDIWLEELLLSFFFGLHFFISILRGVLIFFHLLLLHFFGSVSRLRSSVFSKVLFFQKFCQKDLNLFWILLLTFLFIFPVFLMEEENFLMVDLISSPLHIKPEWYFLFLYSILRRVPSKLVGVLIIFFAILFFFWFKGFLIWFYLGLNIKIFIGFCLLGFSFFWVN